MTIHGEGAGALVFVVGPSGVGKDSILNSTRIKTLAYPWCRVARRYITRDPRASGEPHVEISRVGFESLASSGQFLLWWRAHETCYGVPVNVRSLVKNGAVVLVNGSREQIVTLRSLSYIDTRVVAVTASHHVLRDRLRERGRESDDQIDERLARGRRFALVDDVDFELPNETTVDSATERLFDYCLSLR